MIRQPMAVQVVDDDRYTCLLVQLPEHLHQLRIGEMVAKQTAYYNIIPLLAELLREHIVLLKRDFGEAAAALSCVLHHEIVGVYTCQLQRYVSAACPLGDVPQRVAAAAPNVGQPQR